jgi:tetratricopeptide (TPR) repeat protein
VLLLFFLASFALYKRYAWLKIAAGLFGLSLGLLVVCKMVFYNPALAEDICDQNVQVVQMTRFGNQLFPNRGIDPTLRIDLSTYTVAGRLDLTWHFVTWGWYFLMLSSIIVLISGLIAYPPKKIVKVSLISLLCGTIIFSLVTVRPVLAEYSKSRGDFFLSVQHYEDAYRSYRAALRHNGELISNSALALNYGETSYHLKLIASPYYFYYWGTFLAGLGKMPEAISILTKAVAISNDDPDLKRALAKALTRNGSDYYTKGIMGSAISSWEHSAGSAPEEIENWYYLSLVYTKLGLYENAVSAGQQFTRVANNTTLLANTYCNMGDACYWSKNYLLAREYYLRSQILDIFSNYRAGRSLGGT